MVGWKNKDFAYHGLGDASSARLCVSYREGDFGA